MPFALFVCLLGAVLVVPRVLVDVAYCVVWVGGRQLCVGLGLLGAGRG